MTERELINSLVDCLRCMMDWAREVPDEMLDGDPDMRSSLRDDLKEARNLIDKAKEVV